MKLESVIETLERIAPLQMAEEWDNAGLLLKPLRQRSIKKVLLTIDLTEAVADEAIAAKTDLIVAYHPILFHPINRLSADIAQDRAVIKLVQKNVAVYPPCGLPPLPMMLRSVPLPSAREPVPMHLPASGPTAF